MTDNNDTAMESFILLAITIAMFEGIRKIDDPL
jgi:hypothetical protein